MGKFLFLFVLVGIESVPSAFSSVIKHLEWLIHVNILIYFKWQDVNHLEKLANDWKTFFKTFITTSSSCLALWNAKGADEPLAIHFNCGIKNSDTDSWSPRNHNNILRSLTRSHFTACSYHVALSLCFAHSCLGVRCPKSRRGKRGWARCWARGALHLPQKVPDGWVLFVSQKTKMTRLLLPLPRY